MIARTTTIQGNSVLQNNLPSIVTSGSGVILPGTFRNQKCNLILNNDILSKHILISGGTGCGKTNVFNFLIKSIKSLMGSNDVMIIFDTKGDFYSQFYSKDDLVIANSNVYTGSSEWNIFKEILIDGEKEEDIISNTYEISHALFKDAIEKSTQPFFPNAACDLFSAILIAFIRKGMTSRDFVYQNFNNKALREFLDSLSVAKLKELLNPDLNPDLSSVLMYIGDGKNGQALGVFAELQNVCRKIFIGSFAKTGKFSARQFVREKGRKTLFIEYDLAVGNTLSPMYSLLFDLCLKEAMGRKRNSGNVYLICDEFKLLPYLRHIEDGANFGRGLGVKIIAGIQSIEQLYENYGENRGRNIASGFSTMISFKANDTVTREYISNLYGTNIVLEQYQNAVGNLIEEKREGKTVEDWDINNLKPGESMIGIAFEKPFMFKFDLYKR